MAYEQHLSTLRYAASGGWPIPFDAEHMALLRNSVTALLTHVRATSMHRGIIDSTIENTKKLETLAADLAIVHPHDRAPEHESRIAALEHFRRLARAAHRVPCMALFDKELTLLAHLDLLLRDRGDVLFDGDQLRIILTVLTIFPYQACITDEEYARFLNGAYGTCWEPPVM